MANSNKDGLAGSISGEDGLAGSIAGELHIGIQGPPGPVGPQGPVGPVGPEATPLTVVISGTAASHSASEIIAAIKAETIVEVNMGTERLQVTAWDESAVTVTCAKAPAPNRTGALLSCNEYTIRDDKTWAVVANNAISTNFTAKSGQVVAVENGDPSGPTAFKAIDLREEFIATYGTTTFAEIYDAVRALKAVYCKNGNVTLPMTAYSAQSISAEFGGVTKDGKVVWKVDNATWSSDVLVDEDKFVAEYGTTTYREIYAAMQEGKSVYCKNGYYEFPMVKFTAPSWTAYFGGMADGQNVTFKVQGETWSSYNAETGGGGLSATAVNLLIEILESAVYNANVTGKIASLKEALGYSGGSGGDEPDIPDTPDDPDEPVVVDDITVENGVMTIISVGSEITVSDGVMTIA